MVNKRIDFFVLCIGVALISACAKYEPKMLDIPQVQAQEKNGFVVRAKELKDKEAKNIFGGCSPASKGYKAVQIFIINKNDQACTLQADSISLGVASAQLVAEQIGFNTAGRVAGWGAASLILLPLLIPAYVDGTASSQANKELKQDFVSRTISNASSTTIQPNGLMNKIFFVSNEDFCSTFSFELVNKGTGVVEKFTINL